MGFRILNYLLAQLSLFNFVFLCMSIRSQITINVANRKCVLETFCSHVKGTALEIYFEYFPDG